MQQSIPSLWKSNFPPTKGHLRRYGKYEFYRSLPLGGTVGLTTIQFLGRVVFLLNLRYHLCHGSPLYFWMFFLPIGHLSVPACILMVLLPVWFLHGLLLTWEVHFHWVFFVLLMAWFPGSQIPSFVCFSFQLQGRRWWSDFLLIGSVDWTGLVFAVFQSSFIPQDVWVPVIVVYVDSRTGVRGGPFILGSILLWLVLGFNPLC